MYRYCIVHLFLKPMCAMIVCCVFAVVEEGGTLECRQTVLVSLSRVCHALAHICPNMKLCSLATALVSADTVRVRARQRQLCRGEGSVAPIPSG